MATDKSKAELVSLGQLELKILRILWDSKQSLDVRAVAAALGGSRAYTTVMTTLNRLYTKGYLRQQKQGRAYFYSARVTQRSVLQKMLARIAKTFYNGDISQLVPQLLGLDKELTTLERERLKQFAARIQDQSDERNE